MTLNIFLLLNLPPDLLTLVATALDASLLEDGISRGNALIFLAENPLIPALYRLFCALCQLQNEAGYNRLLAISPVLPPAIVRVLLFILLAERIETHDLADGNEQPLEESENETSTCQISAQQKLGIHEFSVTYALTRRETEITQLIIQGKSNAMIAGELFISETTVKKHVSNIFDKTGVSRREELIVRVREDETI